MPFSCMKPGDRIRISCGGRYAGMMGTVSAVYDEIADVILDEMPDAGEQGFYRCSLEVVA